MARKRKNAPAKAVPPEGHMSPAEVQRLYAEERAFRRRAGYCFHDGDAPVACPDCGQDLAEELARVYEAWRLLWKGTLDLLEREKPGAYRRLLTKFGRHGLTSLQFPSTRLVGEDELSSFPAALHPRLRAERRIAEQRAATGERFIVWGRYAIGQRPTPPGGPQRGFPPTDAILDRFRAFAEDQRPVPMRGHAKPAAPAPRKMTPAMAGSPRPTGRGVGS